MVRSRLSHVQHKNTQTVAIRPTARSKTTCWRPAQEIQGSVACEFQVMQHRSYKLGNSGRWQVCLEGGVLQRSERIRGAAHRHGQGSSCSKEGPFSLSLLHLLHVHVCHMWSDLFVSYRPVQSSTKPSLRFVVSTTHSIDCVPQLYTVISTYIWAVLTGIGQPAVFRGSLVTRWEAPGGIGSSSGGWHLMLLVGPLTCKTVSRMTYTVLVETLNPTHSLTHSLTDMIIYFIRQMSLWKLFEMLPALLGQ